MSTKKEILNEMIALAQDQIAASETAKALKAKAKEAGFDGAVMMKVAKAIAQAKEGELVELSEAVIDTVEAYTES
jgi:glutathionylspermidine synthase